MLISLVLHYLLLFFKKWIRFPPQNISMERLQRGSRCWTDKAAISTLRFFCFLRNPRRHLSVSLTLQNSYLNISKELLWDKTHKQILANKHRRNANLGQIICYLWLISLAPERVLTFKSVFSWENSPQLCCMCMCICICLYSVHFWGCLKCKRLCYFSVVCLILSFFFLVDWFHLVELHLSCQVHGRLWVIWLVFSCVSVPLTEQTHVSVPQVSTQHVTWIFFLTSVIYIL